MVAFLACWCCSMASDSAVLAGTLWAFFHARTLCRDATTWAWLNFIVIQKNHLFCIHYWYWTMFFSVLPIIIIVFIEERENSESSLMKISWWRDRSIDLVEKSNKCELKESVGGGGRGFLNIFVVCLFESRWFYSL